MELTEQQKRKLLSAAEIVDKGDMAVLGKLLEFEDLIQGNTDKITECVLSAEEDIKNLSENLTLEIKNRLSEIQDGEKGENGIDGKDGKDGRDGRDGRNGIDGIDGRDGKDGKDGINGKDGSPDTPDQVVDKVNQSKNFISEDRIPALAELRRIALANASSLPITTSIINGKRAKNFQFNGATVSVVGDTAFITTSSGGGHTIQDEGTPLTQRTNLNFVGAGVTVTDDAGNDATVVTISTSAGAGYQSALSGLVDGSNTVFTWATAPNALMVDGVMVRKVASDGTTNWTGTTTTTLSVAPNYDIAGIA